MTRPTSTVPALLAVLVCVGFFGALWAVLDATEVGDGALLLLGGAASAFGAVVQFYFGSSQGSRDKDALLRRERDHG